MRLAGLALASLLPPVLSDPVMPQAVSEAWGGAAEKKPPSEPWVHCAKSGLLAKAVIASC